MLNEYERVVVNSSESVMMSVLTFIESFSDGKGKDQNARRFMNNFEEAMDLENVVSDKLKMFYLCTKLSGLPAEWYESVRASDEHKTWESVKSSETDLCCQLFIDWSY